MEKETVIIEHKGYKNRPVTIDDIPDGNMRLVADLCGLDVAVSLMKNLKGLTIAVPSNGFDKVERQIIYDFYNGTTERLKQLALRLDMNEQTVRNILRKKNLEVTAGQQNMFKDGWQNG